MDALLKAIDRSEMILLYIHELGHTLGWGKGYPTSGVMQGGDTMGRFTLVRYNYYASTGAGSNDIEMIIDVEGVNLGEGVIEFCQLLYSLPVGYPLYLD